MSALTHSLKRRLKLTARRIQYLGRGRRCPICNKESRRFADFGSVRRHDAQCVWCGALERHRLAWLFLHRELRLHEIPKSGSFFHIAPELGIEKRLRNSFQGKYVTADLLDPNVDLQIDISSIPLPNDSFDVIYCSHVLEHVPDDRKAMRELARVLKPSGTAIVMVPVTVAQTFEDPTVQTPEERLRVFGQRDHVRRYGPDIADRLKNSGFNVRVVAARDFLSVLEAEQAGLINQAGDVIYVCTRA